MFDFRFRNCNLHLPNLARFCPTPSVHCNGAPTSPTTQGSLHHCWISFFLDFLWNKNPKCKKPLERFVLTDTTCGMAYLHHQGFWIETNSSRSMPISSLSRNHPAFTHWKSCFQLKFSQCCCNWTPPKCRLSAFMKCGSGQWSHRHHMPQTQKTHIGMTLRMSSCTLSPLG